MNTTVSESLNHNLDEKSEAFAGNLKNVLKKFDETYMEEYFKLNDDVFYKSFVKVKNNFTDKFSVMNRCICKLKIAVKELESVCTEFTKSFSEGGLFSVSNIYLKKISKYAKSFHRDLDRLETTVESKNTCQKNFNKFSKSLNDLELSLNSAANSRVKTLRNPAKIQNTRVRNLMHEISSEISSFYWVYNRYKDICFEE